MNERLKSFLRQHGVLILLQRVIVWQTKFKRYFLLAQSRLELTVNGGGLVELCKHFATLQGPLNAQILQRVSIISVATYYKKGWAYQKTSTINCNTSFRQLRQFEMVEIQRFDG